MKNKFMIFLLKLKKFNNKKVISLKNFDSSSDYSLAENK